MALPAGRRGIKSSLVDWQGNINEDTLLTDLLKKIKISNPNLLDNAWFTVNQRGQTSYTITTSHIYTFDRWYLGWYGKVDKITNGIKYSNPHSVNSTLQQKFENALADNIYTVSMLLTDGTIRSKSGQISSSASISFALGGGSVIAVTNADFKMIISPSAEYNIKALKLELGSISTLANDVAPNYAEELLKCQRYFVRYKGNTSNHAFAIGHPSTTSDLRIPIWLPTSMRTNAPTVTLGGILKASLLGSTEAFNCTGLSRVDMSNNVIVLMTSGSFQTEKSYITILADGNTYIDISADL